MPFRGAKRRVYWGRTLHTQRVAAVEHLLRRSRLLVYAVGFAGALIIDVATPLGVADWLVEVILIWFSTVFGPIREMYIVAAIGSATMVVGMWTSPASLVPFWVGALNRLVAIGASWTMVHVAVMRLRAEAEREKAAVQVKVLQGLLPICAGCKAIRTAGGDWQRLERYLTEHTEAELTHTYCPACAARLYEELGDQQA